MAICLMTILSLSMIVVAPLAHSAYAATPTTLYVSPTGSDTTGTGSVSSPFATISHAVDIATAGMTVVVEPGTYTEMVLITKQLTLMSQTLEPSSTIIDATGQLVGIAVIGSATAGTIVEGFTVMNANNEGIFVQDSSNVVVDNNVVAHNGLNILPGLGESKGIQFTGTSKSTAAGNTVVGNMYGGIGVTDNGPTDASWNATAAPTSGIPAGSANPGDTNLISGNVIANNQPNHCAIVISAYNPGEGVANNIVSGNTVVDNENGIIVAADSPNTAAINNTVTNNNILNNGEGGVIVHSNAPGDIVTGNVISNNVISGDGGLPDEQVESALVGVIIGGEGPVAVQSTSIIGNIFQNEAVGVQIVNGQNTRVGGNTMGATVQLAYNGTVIQISTSSAGSATTVTATATLTLTQTATSIQTTTVNGSATATSTSSSGGLTFSLALLTAVGTLIVGLVAGMIVRPIREASGR
ncbi:MAG: right-handed parallel beta-helix repeat-containing protein [Nitrososphaerales archaeon]